MKTFITDFTNYNIWANERLIDICKSTPDLLELNAKSSFQTVRRTLLHIYDAELGWLNRMKGISHTRFPSSSFEGTNEDVFRVVLETSNALNDYAEAQEEGFFDQTCDYQTTKGSPNVDKYGEIILHVVNHSSYHRGQVVTMLRGLGASEMQSMDYYWYLRGKKG